MGKSKDGSAPSEPKDWSRLKLPPQWVPSDGYEIEVNGETVAPHAGEKVGISARRTIGQQYALEGMKFQEGEDKRAWLARIWEALTHGYILVWTWTDDFGDALPPPAECSVEALDNDEITYLWQIVLHRGVPPKALPAKTTPEDPDPNPSGDSPTG